MSDTQFNPFDLSARKKAAKSTGHDNHLQIHIRPELSNPLNLFLGRCDMFLERAKAQGEIEIALELQKIFSTAKYLHSLINSSEIMRQARLQLELGTSFTSETESTAKAGTIASLISPSGAGECGSLLLVDDDNSLLRALKYILEEQGHTVVTSKSAEEALAVLHTKEFDLVLTDVVLPGISGYQLLDYLKADMHWREIPIIILSSLNEKTTAAQCIQRGAEDFLAKPIDPPLLLARIAASLEKRRLRELERGYMDQLQAEQEKSERLLLNILPAPIAERLKKGESTIADSFPEVTVLFADIAGFTKLAASVTPPQLVHALNDIFSAFDHLAEQHGLEKIKTIGDAYMVVGGLPTPREDHATAIAAMALDIQKEIESFNRERHTSLSIRVGIHTGPVIAGVIGRKKFTYDLWGDTVNTASRMQSLGQNGRIQVTDVTYELLKDKFTFTRRGKVDVKGKGSMVTYFLTGHR
jgi:adenylate cyclase